MTEKRYSISCEGLEVMGSDSAYDALKIGLAVWKPNQKQVNIQRKIGDNMVSPFATILVDGSTILTAEAAEWLWA